jgi:multiple sugar transport system ATP-binding protein
MAQVELSNVSKSYGSSRVLHDIDLRVADGELVVLVGPSGCGKSTLLRMICGLEPITAGELRIDGVVVNDLPPAQRGIAMVFQSYALYPHMTVRGNMAFGLKIHGAGKADRNARVLAAAKALHIDHLLDRRPRELSGGQRQRVAIGRAIVRQPKLFLFDEPLSNLDAALRVKTRIELARLHRELTATMVYVTHDQVEAMTLGDRIVVMHEGRIQQAGSPLALYEHPANRFVASFIGSPTINLVPSTALACSAAGVRLEVHAGSVVDAEVDGSTLQAGAQVEIGIRPEHLAFDGGEPAPVPADAPPCLRFGGEVSLVEQLGESHLIYLRCADGLELVSRAPGHTPVRIGDRIGLVAQASRLHVFDAAGVACRRLSTAGTPAG